MIAINPVSSDTVLLHIYPSAHTDIVVNGLQILSNKH